MLQQTIAVFLVLGLLLTALWLLRRQGIASFKFAPCANQIGRSRSRKRVSVRERVALTSQHSLHLVSIDSQFILFVASPTGCHAVEHSALLLTQGLKPTFSEARYADESRGEAASC